MVRIVKCFEINPPEDDVIYQKIALIGNDSSPTF